MSTMQAVGNLALSCLPSAALIRLLFEDGLPSSSFVSGDVPAIYTERLKRRLEVARELLIRELKEKMRASPVLSSPEVVIDWLRLHFKDRQREAFVALALDSQHRLIEASELFQGTVDSCSVHVREVAQFALTHRASALMVAHNHPSCSQTVSESDKALTARLVSALSLIDVRLLDHFIVAGPAIVSMATQGLM